MMDRQDVYQKIRMAIYSTISHPDLAFSGGVQTDLGTFYRLSSALTETTYHSAWFSAHTNVHDQADIKQLKEQLSSMILLLIGRPDIIGYEHQSLITSIVESLTARSN